MKQTNMGLLRPGKGFFTSVFAAFGLLFSTSSQAQVIVGASFADNVVAAGVNTQNVNCDMLYHPGGHLRAIAYDDFTSGNGFVQLNEFAGGSATITIPGGLYPDVVIGHNTGSPGNYILGVVYGASVTFFRTYSITGVGTGTLNVVLTSSQQISIPGSATSRYPHIDLYPDLFLPPFAGFPTLHNFIITWSEALIFSPGMDVFATTGDLMSPLALSPYYSITTGGTGMMSDVAALFDKPAARAFGYIPYFNTATNSLDIAELNVSTGTVNVSTGIDNPIASLPRIDAMNLYDGFSGMQHYQVAYPKLSGGVQQMFSYNNLTGVSSLSSLLATINNIQPAVAAGAGPLYGAPDYGNDNYTVAWHLPTASRYLSRSINPWTGGISATFPNYYITNQTPLASTPVSLPQSPVAVSTATNNGTRLLTAWAGNGRVWYKYNSNTASYKTTGVDDMPRNEQYALYPNPATTELHINGAGKASYTISDLTGRIILQGSIDDKNNTIAIANLANGVYVASVKEGEVTTLLKFTKQ